MMEYDKRRTRMTDRRHQVFENIVGGVKCHGYQLRVWFARTSRGPSPEEDAHRLKEFCLSREVQWNSKMEIDIARDIADNLEGVNAVEVRGHSLGSLVYNDWP